MLLNVPENLHALLAVHHVDGKSSLAKSPRSTDPVEVRLIVWIAIFVHRRVKVDHHRHLFDINTCMWPTRIYCKLRLQISSEINKCFIFRQLKK